jgi:transposase
MLASMKAYSLDLRQKILRACDQQLGSPRAIAALFGVSQSFVEKLLRRRRTSGDIAPRPHAGGRRALCDEAALGCVRQRVQAQPDATLAELCEQLYTPQGLCVSVPTMACIVTHLGLPRKKSRSTPMSATPSGSSTRARPIRQESPRLTPTASSASVNQGSTLR